jgi:hypothetical protein
MRGIRVLAALLSDIVRTLMSLTVQVSAQRFAMLVPVSPALKGGWVWVNFDEMRRGDQKSRGKSRRRISNPHK